MAAEGKRVVVVGGGNGGMAIALSLNDLAAQAKGQSYTKLAVGGAGGAFDRRHLWLLLTVRLPHLARQWSGRQAQSRALPLRIARTLA